MFSCGNKKGDVVKMEMFRDLAIIIVLAKVFGIIARRFKMPSVVGEIIAGLIMGPSILKIVGETNIVSSFAHIGVILLMFTSGLGTNFKELKETGFKSFVIAFMGVIVPLIGGTILYMVYNQSFSFGSLEFYKALFIGCIMTATSVSITVETLKEMGKLNSKVGTTLLSAAIIDDILGILVLTIIISLKDPTTSILVVLLKNILYFLFIIIGGMIVNKIFIFIDKKYPHTRRLSILSLGFCFINVYIAEKFFGVADITGAFFSGIILCNLLDSNYIQKRLDIPSYLLFSPIFFVSIGLKTNLSALSLNVLGFSILFVFIALITKIIGCFCAGRICKYNKEDSIKIGIGMMTRGEVALIISGKGLDLGLMDSSMFTSVILLIIASSIITPLALGYLYNKQKKAVIN